MTFHFRMNELDDDVSAVVEPGIMRLEQQTRFKGFLVERHESLFQRLIDFVTEQSSDRIRRRWLQPVWNGRKFKTIFCRPQVPARRHVKTERGKDRTQAFQGSAQP